MRDSDSGTKSGLRGTPDSIPLSFSHVTDINISDKVMPSDIQDHLQQGWLDIYRRYISLIYIRYFSLKISDIFDIFNFYQVFFKYLEM